MKVKIIQMTSKLYKAWNIESRFGPLSGPLPGSLPGPLTLVPWTGYLPWIVIDWYDTNNSDFLWLQYYNLWMTIGNRFQLIDVNTFFSWTICIIVSFSVVLMMIFHDSIDSEIFRLSTRHWNSKIHGKLNHQSESDWNNSLMSSDQIIWSFQMTVLFLLTRANFLK